MSVNFENPTSGKINVAATLCQYLVMFLMEKKISSVTVDTSISDEDVFLLLWFILELVWKSMVLKVNDEKLINGKCKYQNQNKPKYTITITDNN